MSRRQPHIPLKRLVYIGCEGKSEANYAGFLQDIIRDARLAVHLHIDELAPGAGDPLARIELAVRRLGLMRNREVPAERFAFLDSDQAVRDPGRAERARRLADQNRISIIWQDPCFEAMLLRHINGRAGHRPPDTPGAGRALEREWPQYIKPMSRAALGDRFDMAALTRAAVVERGLRGPLICLGLIPAE